METFAVIGVLWGAQSILSFMDGRGSTTVVPFLIFKDGSTISEQPRLRLRPSAGLISRVLMERWLEKLLSLII